jgi:hypothetical protein
VPKIKNKLFVVVLLLSLLVGSVYGAVEISDEKIVFEADYNDFDDEDQETIRESVQFTVKNTGAEAISVKTVVTNLPNLYSIEGNIANVEIPAKVDGIDGSATISFSINIPHKNDAGEKVIGTVSIREINGAELTSKSLIQNTKSMLEFSKLEVDYVDEEDRNQGDDFDGDTDDNKFDLEDAVKAGTEVVMIFKIKNLFNNNYDDSYNELEEIEITIEEDDSDLLEDDFDDEYIIPDLAAGKKDELIVRFNVNKEADAQEYTLDIKIRAEDGKNAVYEINKELSFEVKRKRDDIQIIKAVIQPATVTTCDTGFRLDLEVQNAGTRDQKYSGVAIFNQELGINENIQDINLDQFSDSNNDWKRLFSFDNLNLKKKIYPLEIKTYVKRTELSNSEIVDLSVKDCPTKEPIQTKGEQTEEIKKTEEKQEIKVTPTEKEESIESTTETVSKFSIIKTVEDPYTLEDIIVGAVIVVMVLVLALIVIFFVMLMR